MKFIHTSDWHLGQNFYSKSRKHEHEQFLTWLLNTVQEQNVDAIIVAGDIFDTSAPPSYAREMYNQFVVDANKLNCQLILLGGNHDSVSVLHETKQLLKHLNTEVIAHAHSDYSEQIVPLKNKQGEVKAVVCAIPFIRPRDVLTSQAGINGTERQKQLGEAIKHHYSQMHQQALQYKQQLEAQLKIEHLPIIATGHLTALGVTQSESVRDIYIGNLDGFAADGFPDVDYIALGHIHRPQIVAKSEHIRYSGSPIALSFDELKSNKQVVLVDFTNQKSISTIAVPTFQPLARLKGDLDSIQAQLEQYTVHNNDLPVWLSIEVSVQDYLSDLQERIRVLTEDLNVEVLQLKRTREQSKTTLEQEATETLSELKPIDVFNKRIALEDFSNPAEQASLERITVKFQQIMAEVTNGNEEE